MTTEIEKLPRLIARAMASLEKATTAGEVLEAKEQANVAYTAAKMAARMSRIKDAHDAVLTACRKSMGDALEIEARAQVRLADEYDAAQKRGEVGQQGNPGGLNRSQRERLTPTTEDIGLTRKQVHAARAVRDAEKAKPGIVHKTVEQKLEAGEEPTRADVKRAVSGNPKRTTTKAGAKAKNKQARKADMRKVASTVSTPKVGQKYKIIVVDMPILDMAMVESWADADCILWVWLPDHSRILPTLNLIDKLGFREIGLVTWLKDFPSKGQSGVHREYASAVDHCLVASRGTNNAFRFPKKPAFTGGIRDSWSRPLEFYMMVGRALSLKHNLEIGGSGPTRAGWDREVAAEALAAAE